MKTASKSPELNWERRLREVASSFPYPDTPDIHAAVQKRLRADGARRSLSGSSRRKEEWRRLAVAALVALLLLAALLAVPTVRAAIARILRVGAITIVVSETDEDLGRLPESVDESAADVGENATHTAVPTTLPTRQRLSTREVRSVTGVTPPAIPDIFLFTPTSPTRSPTPTPTATRRPRLEGPLTLLGAEAVVDFRIQLPDVSSGLESPDEIYLQSPGDTDLPSVAILIWVNPQGLETSRLVLYEIGVPEYGLKAASLNSLMETEVNDQRAFWIEGDHLLQIPDSNGNVEERVIGNVLVWTDGRLTYRLEGAPSVEDAVRIAESLAPGLEN